MLSKLIVFLCVASIAFADNPPFQLYDNGTNKGVVFSLNCTNGVTCSKSGVAGTIQGGNSGWVISGSNIYETGSNVGIGSATPGALLDVSGTVRFKSMVDSKSIFNNGEYDNGTCTTAATIDPANGTRQKLTLTNGDACALTFTQPVVGTSVISLKIVQSAVSSYNGTISGCKWAGGSAMVPTATNAAVDYISVYEDGTNAYCGIVGQAFS